MTAQQIYIEKQPFYQSTFPLFLAIAFFWKQWFGFKNASINCLEINYIWDNEYQ